MPAILRDDVPELLRAAERMLEAVVAYIDLVPEGNGRRSHGPIKN